MWYTTHPAREPPATVFLSRVSLCRLALRLWTVQEIHMDFPDVDVHRSRCMMYTASVSTTPAVKSEKEHSEMVRSVTLSRYASPRFGRSRPEKIWPRKKISRRWTLVPHNKNIYKLESKDILYMLTSNKKELSYLRIYRYIDIYRCALPVLCQGYFGGIRLVI